MLALIRAAAECKDENLKGKYLAKAELHIGGETRTASAKLTVKRGKLAVVKVCGGENTLTLRLMSPTGAPGSEAKTELPRGADVFSVTEAEIREYLRLTGDTNPIHGGEKPVVPGLLLLLRLLPHERVSAEARFLVPLYAGETLGVCGEKSEITVYSERGTAVKIKLRG